MEIYSELEQALDRILLSFIAIQLINSSVFVEIIKISKIKS